MVDFNALMNRTPEESKAIRDEMDAEFAARMDALLVERRAMLEAIQDDDPRLSEWDREFITSMRRLAASRDLVSGKIGGELSFLSDPRVTYLVKIHQKCVKPVEAVPKSLYPTRMRS